jgi:hypothetical protein
MPFTFSHPAVVLPIYRAKRRFLSLTGLVVGSMTPDFEYFLRLRVRSDYSHTLGGIFWFDLPLALIACFLFHFVIRRQLIMNLPVILRRRFDIYIGLDAQSIFVNRMSVVILSCLIGIISHVFWDSFTHRTGLVVSIIPFLQNSIRLSGWSLPIFKIIQHLSTLVGGVVILYYVAILPSSNNSFAKPNSFFWLATALVLLLVVLLRFKIGVFVYGVGDLIVTIISGGVLGIFLASLISSRR